MQRVRSENNGRFSEPGWGFRLGGLAVQLPGAGGNQSKGQECSQGFWASGLYYAKGTGLPREGEHGQGEQLEPEVWAGQERKFLGRKGGRYCFRFQELEVESPSHCLAVWTRPSSPGHRASGPSAAVQRVSNEQNFALRGCFSMSALLAFGTG